MDNVKKELLAIIDEIGECQKCMADLQRQRDAAVRDIDQKIHEEGMKLGNLYDKKRVIENAVIEAIMKE
jgi:hypothetical protein